MVGRRSAVARHHRSLRQARRERGKGELLKEAGTKAALATSKSVKRLLPRLNYKIFRHVSCDSLGLCSMVMGVIVVVVVGGLTLYYGARGLLDDKDDPFLGRSVMEAMYVTYTMVVEGGTQEGVMSSMASAASMSNVDLYFLRAVVGLVSLFGVLTVHATVAFILNQVTAFLDRFEAGPKRLELRNHILIVNLTERAFDTMNQLVLSLAGQTGTIVVIDSRRREVLEDLVTQRVNVPSHRRYCRRLRSGWDPAARVEVLCRTGNTHSAHELQNVSASLARVVIVFAVPQPPMKAHRAAESAELAALHAAHADGSAAATAAATSTAAVADGALHDAGTEAIWHDNPDARTIGTILALVSGPAAMRGHIVAEAVDSDSRPVMALIGGRHVETVETRQIVRHLLVQSALMPGISFVFDELLSFEGAEFYYRGFGSALAGTRFGDALSLFDSAVPIGVEEEESGALRINPPDEYLLRAEDKLVFVADDAIDCRLSSSAARPAWSLDCPYGEEESDATARVRRNTTLGASIRTLTLKHDEKPRLKMLVCGWRDDLGGMISALDKKVAPGSELQIFCTLKAEQRNSIFRLGHLPDTHNLTVHHFVGHPEVKREMEELGGVAQYDRVIIVADESNNPGASQVMMSDSNAVSTLLLARNDVDAAEMEAECSGVPLPQPTSILCELLDARTSDMICANAAIANEGLFLSNTITANILAMVAGTRERHHLLRALLGAHGAELRVRRCHSVVHRGESICFWECARRVRQVAGEVLIGYMARARGERMTEEVSEVRGGSGAPTEPLLFELRAGVALNPPNKHEAVDLGAYDLDLVVVAGEQRVDLDAAAAATPLPAKRRRVPGADAAAAGEEKGSATRRVKTSSHGDVRPASTEYAELWRECQDLRRGVTQLRQLVRERSARRAQARAAKQ